jgi:hypothetical protein
MGENGFQSSVDPGTIELAAWAAKHFGVGHSAEALARKVNALASDWLEGALAELVEQGLGPDRVTIRMGRAAPWRSPSTVCRASAGRLPSRRK